MTSGVGAERRTWTRLLAVGLILGSTSAFAHLCNNIYRTPDRVIVKPEKQSTTVAGRETFKVYVQNNYPTLLNNVRLVAKPATSEVQARVTPESIRVMKAGERASFVVELTGGAQGGGRRSTVSLGISADQLGFKPVEETTSEALKQILRTEGNGSATVQVAESLLRRKDPAGIEHLMRMAGDRRQGPDYRARAIRAIGKAGTKANIPFLRTLLQDQDGFVRGNALLALGLLRDEAATFRAFGQERDDFVRACAYAGYALAHEKDTRVVAELRQGLASGNVYVRIACGWALAARRQRDGIQALDQAFATDDCMQRVMAGDAMVDVANRG